MSVHIAAKKGQIAKTVLQPGDPLRAKYIADHFLTDVKLVSQTRNIYYYTGLYKGKEVSIGASGMGIPSIGIYSYELFTEFEVDTIIRIGTCGSYTTELNTFDILNVEFAASESTYAQYAWEIADDRLSHQGTVFNKLNTVALEQSLALKAVTAHTSDIFYRKNLNLPDIVRKYDCAVVEMEAFALFANAQYLGKNAAALLTVSDVLPTGAQISANERQNALTPMIELALETALKL